MKLPGKIAVITGGNSGIGFGIARRLADEGAKGIIIGRNQKTLADASKKLGGAFLPIQCNVTRIEGLESAFKDAKEQFGGIDVLVVNAGGAVGPGTVQPFADVDEQSFDSGALVPVADEREFSLDQIGDAFRHMESNTQFGKVTVTV